MNFSSPPDRTSKEAIRLLMERDGISFGEAMDKLRGGNRSMRGRIRRHAERAHLAECRIREGMPSYRPRDDFVGAPRG